jgi:hypothetical protein
VDWDSRAHAAKLAQAAYTCLRDPVKSLVECGVGDNVDTVIVDGRS